MSPGDAGWSPVIGFAALIGLLTGSFLNVVIWRVPRGISIVRPPSACPQCGHRIRPWENVPLLSWLILRGRCRSCRMPISLRYPAVELLTAVLFTLCVLQFHLTWTALAFCYLSAIGVALAFIDLDVHKLPDRLVLPAYIVMPMLLGVQSLIGSDGSAMVRLFVGGAALYAFYFLALLCYPGGMGFGDVKLAGVLGGALAWLGWGQFAVGTFGAFVLGGVFGGLLLALHRAGRKTGIPFGPWMIAGALVGVCSGEQLWDVYLRLAG